MARMSKDEAGVKQRISRGLIGGSEPDLTGSPLKPADRNDDLWPDPLIFLHMKPVLCIISFAETCWYLVDPGMLLYPNYHPMSSIHHLNPLSFYSRIFLNLIFWLVQ